MPNGLYPPPLTPPPPPPNPSPPNPLTPNPFHLFHSLPSCVHHNYRYDGQPPNAVHSLYFNDNSSQGTDQASQLFHTAAIPHSTQWRHNERNGVSINQPRDCLLSRLFWRRSKKISKLRVTGLCEGNSPETGEFPAHRDSNAENVSIWWRHHVLIRSLLYEINSFVLICGTGITALPVTLRVDFEDELSIFLGLASQATGLLWDPNPYGTKWPQFCRRFFECIFVNEKFCVLIKTSLKFVCKDPMYNSSALV